MDARSGDATLIGISDAYDNRLTIHHARHGPPRGFIVSGGSHVFSGALDTNPSRQNEIDGIAKTLLIAEIASALLEHFECVRPCSRHVRYAS